MVDAIGWKAGGVVARVAPATTATPVAPVSTPSRDAAVATSVAAGGIAQSLAAEPPVDAERVSRIKAAIAAGKFPILPSTIADRLLAFKLDWNPNAQA